MQKYESAETLSNLFSFAFNHITSTIWSIYRKSLDAGLLKTFPSSFSRLYASLRWQGRIGPDSFLSFMTILAAQGDRLLVEIVEISILAE